MREFFEKMCKNLDLGNLLEEPLKVTGGLMHKMYKVVTEKGKYIVKLLNPNIMKRPTAMTNFKRAEEMERLLMKNNIKAIYALEFNKKKMQEQDGQYFYVYDWYDGKSLKESEITKENCEIIGKVLAEIHSLSLEKKEWKENKKEIDWDFYLEISKEKDQHIYSLLSKNIDLLKESMSKGNMVISQLPQYRAICHNDLDSKNVLWNKDDFRIIDLECLDYSNPYLELFSLALCWSGYESCNINYDLLNDFINSYFDNSILERNINWEALYYANNERLDWLEYNIKRALLLETNSKEEQQIGIHEVEETINHIIYYDSIKNELLNKL